MNDLFELNQAVFIEKEQIKTDSLKVAQIFGKRHDNVIRAIENLKRECDPDFTSSILRR
ncbi:Rha family transcriptional regulator [Acinetobacter sp. CE-15]|uniref:Rha family transcriptional regulator n=1 Tax=Acinetobacter sp. CE-15 TaxID=3425693 RepID=UPI003DA280E6